VLRRTFATFAAAERRQIGERLRRGDRVIAADGRDDDIDHERAALVLPLLAQILGVEL
jgi:DNA invertase Pin-like site-specific DNA recombinase